MTLSSLQCADVPWGMKVGNTIWHIAGFIGWPFAVLKYKYIFFSNKTYGSNSSNGTRKLV